MLMLCMAITAMGLIGCDIFSSFSESEYVYDAEKVQASIDELTESGYKITMRYLTVDNESGGKPEIQSSGFSIAADGEHWFCEQIEEGEKSTVIIDFSGDSEFVVYEKDGDDEKWEKTSTSYEYFGSKDTVRSIYMDTYIATFTSYGVLGLGLKEKGSVTVAGRACTKYETSVSVLGASYNNEYCIDNETGLCLKNVIAVGSATEGNASASYECTEFKVGYRITIPAESECITDGGYDDGNEGSNGGNDTELPIDVDFSTIISGNGSTDVIYSQLDEETKQLLIAEAAKDGVELSFGADGSMTAVDTNTGDMIVQKPDGTWVIKGDDGSEGQLGGNWPDNEFTKLLPKPDLPLLAANTTEDDFSVAFQNVTVEQIRDYVEKIKAKGFNVNAEITDQEVMGIVVYSYQAENADGYAVTVTFTDGTSGVVIERP